MSRDQNPFGTTRRKEESPLMFDLEDDSLVSNPASAPNMTSSLLPDHTSRPVKRNVIWSRLGTVLSRSPTPELDVVHPTKEPARTAAENERPGFFASDKAYITHWECCMCRFVHAITDQNQNWRWIQEGKKYILRNNEGFVKPPPCKGERCLHARCDTCYDIDRIGYRRQYCSGKVCQRKLTPIWPMVSHVLRPAIPVQVVEYAKDKLRLEPCHRPGEKDGLEERGLPEEMPKCPWGYMYISEDRLQGFDE